jgi:PAS domain S-box-containing protein
MLNTAQLSRETLARAFEQSIDCVKLLSLDGRILWMNPNGQCAMEIDDFGMVRGRDWASMWPAETSETIARSLSDARDGEVVRFDAFCPTAKGSPRWWNVSVSRVEDDFGEPSGFLSISRDITVEERGRQGLLLAAKEMQHRLGNTLAVVSALIMGFARGTPDREVFAKEMQKRLVALSAVQRLFSEDQPSCRVDTLMTTLMAPFEGSQAPLTMGDVPGVSIDRGQADAIALVIGELVVNSLKHGALGNSGTVHVYATSEQGSLQIRWIEKLRDRVVARSREGGQGLSLIRDIVASRQGLLELDWLEAGLTVTMTFKTD